MSTQFLNVTSSDVLGYKQYYRIVFDVSGQVWVTSPDAILNHFYDHMQDTGLLAPLSPNPVVGGDTVMTVDAWTIGDGASATVAEAVRRLEMMSFLGQSSVRSIKRLSGVGDITGGAVDRADDTDSANKQNDENSLGTNLMGFLSGLGDYTTLIVIGLVAYAVITLSAGLSLIPSRKRG